MARKRKVVEFNAQTHAYYVKSTRYSSVTALAKKMQNGYALEQYGKRQVAIGMAQRPDLVQVVASHHGDLTPDARNKINDVCDQAYEAAKAGAAANTGTAIHTVLERIDKGEEFVPFDSAMAQVQVDYRAALDKAGLVAIPSLVERIVVFPDYNLAGTLDRGYMEIGETDPVTLLGDVKSGLNAVSYPHSMAAQLGLYSLAPYMYDPAADELVEPPGWHGCVIAHTPITGGVELWAMDLDVCREVAEHALWLHRWMKRGAPEIIKQWMIVPAAGSAPNPPPAPTTAGAAGVPDGTPNPDRAGRPGTVPAVGSGTIGLDGGSCAATTQPADPFDGLTDGHVDEPADPARRQWIIGRLETLKTVDGALARVGQLWPSGLATLKASDRHTDTDLNRIEIVLDAVEAEFTVSFPVKDPKEKESLATMTEISPRDSTSRRTFSETPKETSPTATSSDSSPISNAPDASSTASSTPDEGGPADPAAVNVLQDAYKALDDGQRAWIAGIARDAQTAGRPIHLQGHPTVRRFEIVRGLVALAGNGCGDNDIVRGLIELALNVDLSWPAGATRIAISHLDADDATKFATLCDALAGGDIVATVGPDGHLSFTPTTTKGQ